MKFKLTNLQGTKWDPSRRRKAAGLSRPVVIGGNMVPPTKSLTIDESTFALYKHQILPLLSAKIISITGPTIESVAKLLAPSFDQPVSVTVEMPAEVVPITAPVADAPFIEAAPDFLSFEEMESILAGAVDVSFVVEVADAPEDLPTPFIESNVMVLAPHPRVEEIVVPEVEEAPQVKRGRKKKKKSEVDEDGELTDSADD